MSLGDWATMAKVALGVTVLLGWGSAREASRAHLDLGGWKWEHLPPLHPPPLPPAAVCQCAHHWLSLLWGPSSFRSPWGASVNAHLALHSSFRGFLGILKEGGMYP